MWPAPCTLTGTHVRLEPTSLDHSSGLAEASTDGDLAALWYTSVPRPEDVEAEIVRRLALQERGQMTPFTTFDARTGMTLGMTTYMNVDATNRRVEIGSTWLRQAGQRGPWNSEAKLLMLGHAFEALDCIAVEFRTHFMNRQSRAAIERLGAKLDGVLRSHQISPNGAVRDTACYSIIASEWPAVRAGLTHRLMR
ncbi:GNAT family N-acetyltransferase [Puniceibacterium sp. IMCC21224]|uniref:GNAT family N-acetyltransferase n=1 Tax=Puniceibacterium sp. IMCC21224 TaxID=1618204 RepID=UPI00064DD5B2|nr:GNAT family protein [Puniceibacterium sp. IMCC21224]KMK66466.1 acetyltransferase, ribosomal protein N-acetylase [Puniceibacterium sp. IMCC21224]